MALLTGLATWPCRIVTLRRALLVPVLMCASCHGGSNMGVVELELYDEPIVCDAELQRCDESPDDDTHRLRSWAFVSPEASRFHPHGIYLYFELPRPGEAVAQVELDVPIRDPDAAELSYIEHDTGFEAQAFEGHVELARDLVGESCECVDGRLELVLTDPGADAALGTTDDRVRRLSRLRFTTNESFCLGPRILAVEPDAIEVDVVDRCPARPGAPSADTRPESRRTSSEREWSSSTSVETGGSCSGDSGESSGGSSCEGDSGGGSSCEGDSSGGSGCEGDSGGGSGCEGDSGGGSGCAGDSGGSGCSGDGGGECSAAGTPAARRAGAIRAWNRFQPLLWVGAVLVYWRARNPRRGRPCARP